MKLTITSAMSEEEADRLAGTFVDRRHYDVLVREDFEVYRPDGRPVLVYRAGVIPDRVCLEAWRALRRVPHGTDNRGLAAGGVADEAAVGVRTIARMKGRSRVRYRPIVHGGRVSRNDYAARVESGIAGYFDRTSRQPYCRLTAFNVNEPARWAAAVPFIQAVDAVFRRELPTPYGIQRAVCEGVPDFHVTGTAFTTITVNRNWRTAVHKDVGDLAAGFGCMAVLEHGTYRGGYLVFPRWRIAVDMRMGGVLLADVHEWHGNTPIVGVRGRYERIACVFYVRERIGRCGSAADELDRAKRRRIGDGLG